jgi:hypothetical protein
MSEFSENTTFISNDNTSSSIVFINEILNKRGLKTPSSSPLYTYHVTLDEYIQLKSLLVARKPLKITASDKLWCAAFCLFCAEWYRREYQSGWAWSGIFEQLGYEFDANQRASVVVKGLTFWQRPINKHSSERNDYLGSVYSEGGLPFGLLASEGSRFQTLFKKLLIEFDKAKTFGQSPIPLIERQLERMPDAFKVESTVNLLHDMVSNLYGLIDTYELDNKSNPTIHLDSMMPKWRISFPIPLDNKTGDVFLAGLLNSAAQQRKESKKNQARLNLMQWLTESNDLLFSASITVSNKFSVPLKKQDLTAPVVEVLVYEGNVQVADLGMARAEFFNDNAILHMRKLTTSFRRFVNELPLKIVVMQAGRVHLIEEIPLSALQCNEMPILLNEQNGKSVVVGSGSASKKAEKLQAVVIEQAEVCASNALISEDLQRDNYRIITFSGELSLQYQFDDLEDSYILSTKEDSFNKNLLNITGDVFDFETDKGYPVYKGLPKITCDFPQTTIFIGDSELGKTSHVTSLYGRQVLRVKEGNKTLYRRKFAILPGSFEVTLQAGQKPNLGSILLLSDKTFIYKVDNSLKTQAISIDGGKRIDLIADDVPPAYFNIDIQANLLSEPISLRVPFPSRGALLFNGDGCELPYNLSLNELLGARAILFKESGKVRTSFQIELRAPTSAEGNASYVFDYQVTKFMEEVNLFDLRESIKELLATAKSSELDEVVRLTVSSSGMHTKQYTIGWYALFANKQDNLLTFDASATIDFAKLKVELINLANPEQNSAPLTQRKSSETYIGSFDLPWTNDFPKLAVPQKESLVKFRPVFLPPTDGAIDSKPVKSLSKAAEVFHPLYNKDAFLSVLNMMANDIEHSGWRYLDCLLEKYSHLPMLTFEAWKALAKHPGCLALLPFATKLNLANVMQILQTEFNIVWELLPLKMWNKSFTLYKNHLSNIGLPEILIDKYLKGKQDEISSFLSLPSLFTLETLTNKKFLQMTEFFKLELLRKNSDESIRWHEHYSYKLKTWLEVNHPNLVAFNIPHNFQTAVMYFPIVAAAVASLEVTWEQVLECDTVNYFFLRQLMDFDRTWFNQVFQGSLCFFITE